MIEPGAGARLAALPHSRYDFDFQGIDPIARWPSLCPYEHIPFQWVCHVERTAAALEHAEFLDLTANECSAPCIERMLEAIYPSDDGPIIMNRKMYEKGRIKDLALRHPEHAATLRHYVSGLFDLLPLVRNYFHNPSMRGSFSIKKVLRAPNLS